jgi:50S ribosomal protein L4
MTRVQGKGHHDIEIWDKPSEKSLHQVVVARLANDRQGNASTKTKNEVAGGGRKPWKQKGTGRARQGSNRSPLWRGGGVTFGPKPRDYSQKINKKQKTVAYLYLFNKMNELKRLKVISAFEVENHKTKDFLKALAKQNERSRKRFASSSMRLPSTSFWPAGISRTSAFAALARWISCLYSMRTKFSSLKRL